MVRSQNLFREYILWRSRMALYAALGLALLLIVGLLTWFMASPENINRFGLLLQLLGVLAVAPDIIGKEKFPYWRKRMAGAETAGEGEAGPVEANQAASPPGEDAPGTGDLESDGQFLAYYQANNLTFLLGNILASTALVWLLVDAVIAPRPDFFPDERTWRILFSMLGFAWLNLFMLLQIKRLSGAVPSPGLLAWFFAVDLFVGVLGILFAGIIHILLYWVIGSARFIFNNGPRRVLLIVTLPFLAVGLFFELIATLP
ncbi:MAG: hypothetical protein EHM21_08755 [Chloroflexi bacterium]|nr:MAG: hypothetical protein EHM21_08755 [Chloroflexota bacterium]